MTYSPTLILAIWAPWGPKSSEATSLMDFRKRLDSVCAAMGRHGLDVLIAVHDGVHFIEKPNPVMVLTRFKSLGPCATVLTREGETTLIVTPVWDAERALETGARVVSADDVMEGLASLLPFAACCGLAGHRFMPWHVSKRLLEALPDATDANAVLDRATWRKTDEEIAHAREATRIAELGYSRLLELARPGISEDELAVELRWQSKSLGAEDNFLLLSAGPHNVAVAPSNGRRLQLGDVIIVELTPSYRGQLAQICRTISVGPAPKILARKYQLVVEAMRSGIAAAHPGVRMGEVCRAIDSVLEAEGYAEYCRPPYIRRRGHGLGFAAIEPGDVARDNSRLLENGMLFMIHPNQYLPETGYLLCGEPVLITDSEAEPLTSRQAALAQVCA